MTTRDVETPRTNAGPAGRWPAVMQFEARAAERPSDLAVACGDRRLTYGALDASASRLARVLAAEGVSRDVPVALVLPRSPELVIAALATWKAGGAYVPLDPSNADQRLLFIIRDAEARVVVTTRELAPRLGGPWKTILVDGEEPRDTGPAPEGTSSSPRDLAYVIYTSGTTGRPKGVEIEHESLSNLIAWHLDAFGLTREDRTTLLAGPGFDAAVWEIWPALAAGASLHLPDDETRGSAELLAGWLVEQRITVSFLPTPLAEAALVQPWPAGTALRVLLTGADTLHRFPPEGLPFTLVNNYGPAEATVVTTSGVVPSAADSTGLPSIGRPITGVDVRLLDEDLHEVQGEEEGEIFIGGVSLARGYRNRPTLSQQRFIADPFGGPGARLYRTGDRARRLPDGALAFLGRIDGGLLVRGQTIEADEFVSLLNGHPSVQASVLAVREEEGESTLVAYVVPVPGRVLVKRELVDLLAAALPESMLPDLYVRLEALPITPNGKVNRAALPTPIDENILRGDDGEPGSFVEERLSEIVAALLGSPSIPRDQNFFLVGGHSTMGAQLIDAVRDALGVELTLDTLFESPTVAGLSDVVEDRIRARLRAMSDDDVRELLGSGVAASADRG